MSQVSQPSHIQWNWATFLWKHIDEIISLRNVGLYAEALEALLNLCDVVPFDVQENMREIISKAEKEIMSIKANSTMDPFKSMLILNREKQTKAKLLVRDLLRELTRQLYVRGYMEVTYTRVINEEIFSDLERKLSIESVGDEE
jgi:hypothetical protein